MGKKRNYREMEQVDIQDLKVHPRNYNNHPDDQIDHINAMIDLAKELGAEDGIYRNIVIAKDGTILAGHGVVQAAIKRGLTTIPVTRLNIHPDDPRALKVLTGDNELRHLVERDDRALSDILKEIGGSDITDLIGTGYDEMMLANLVMVTRPESEIADFDAAAEWVGMPEYEGQKLEYRMQVSFENKENRDKLCTLIGIKSSDLKLQSTWYPPRERDDTNSIKFE